MRPHFALGLAPLALALALAPAPGCQLPTLGGDTDAGASSDAGSATTSDASADMLGVDCTAVSKGVTLCAAVSACPSLQLDPRAFPHCGFRIAGTALDLECYCSGLLCPVGIAPTCADIPALVQDQTEDTVCAKEGLGECASLAGTTTTGGSSCNPTCTDGCGNTPACYQACGC